MDPSGKLIYTRNNAVLSGNLQTIQDVAIADGNRIPLAIKELGTTEVFPTSITHSPNGRFVTVVGDGEYIVYTALAWRNKAFGNGSSFAWADDSNTYAVLEGRTKVRVYKNFRERTTAPMKGAGSWALEGVHGGALLGARGSGFVVFWDWETGNVVRRIDVDAKNIFWSGTGELVAVCGEDSYYVLRFDRDAYNAKLESGAEILDEGVEEAFDLVAEIPEGAKTANWVGDCFIYTTASNRLNYFVGSESYTITPFDQPLYLLGYIPAHSRVYLGDKDVNIFSYALSLSLVEYQTAVLRGDMDAADEILPSIPKEQRAKVATFLEGRGLKELALQVTTDPDHKFDLSLQLDDLDAAVEIARTVPELEAETKWKAIGDRALAVWRFDLARESFEKAGDLGSLMLLLLSIGDRDGLEKLARNAEEKGQNNLAFAALLQLGAPAACVDLLVKTQRAPEAAMFARTYVPSKVPEAVQAWKDELTVKGRAKLASAIPDPIEHPELFEEGWKDAVAREQAAEKQHPPLPISESTSTATVATEATTDAETEEDYVDA
ncbi:uncharacterized protein PHACADRAFT_206262 [Phanerochaete carnosa HHB-10118-sp]|uniref:Uncharacterized protein n=1 Tax=Phanerochaete carnosa (strain HHB-10118-sp) TaxID=650164 RepID=K5XAT8_PHACS|nr:uncharacterized protein PHACADRAFT_206262 [Phanerochaete carnosa HHB-10118-sp]EKM60052.1 hypothetical protein PHACADRAFT_206262 [Phanerochaete carnosa HHB-10118-sp]